MLQKILTTKRWKISLFLSFIVYCGIGVFIVFLDAFIRKDFEFSRAVVVMGFFMVAVILFMVLSILVQKKNDSRNSI